jgi:hypothetical protein
MRGMRKVFEKGRCPLCGDMGGVIHILLKYSDKRM